MISDIAIVEYFAVVVKSSIFEHSKLEYSNSDDDTRGCCCVEEAAEAAAKFLRTEI